MAGCLAETLKEVTANVLAYTLSALMKRSSFHEDFGREEVVQGSTDRGFGVVVGMVCLLIGGAGTLLGHTSGWWLGGAGAVLLLAAILRPSLLSPLNRLWIKFGLLLFAVVNPVVMAILYYLCIVPIGLLMRALGKDLLSLKRDPTVKSYWRPREAAGTGGESMRNQF